MKNTILLLMLPALIACGAKQQTTNAVSAQPKPAVPAAAAAPAPAQTPNVLAGKVDETMNAGGYTYVRIGEQWAAVRDTKLKKGDTVSISPQMVAENFESKTLNRKFDRIVFGELANGAAPAAQPASNPAMASAMGTPAQHMNPAVATPPIKVEKPANGKTIAEVWELKSVMRDQPVVVRGQVVKFLPGIMGKNWLHLRDGSGSHAKGNDDITVTTLDNANVGDVVTVNGTLRVDKDFGAGYLYPVMVEDAKITQ